MVVLDDLDTLMLPVGRLFNCKPFRTKEDIEKRSANHKKHHPLGNHDIPENPLVIGLVRECPSQSCVTIAV